MNLSLPLFDFPDDALPLPCRLPQAGGAGCGAAGAGRFPSNDPDQPDQPDQPDDSIHSAVTAATAVTAAPAGHVAESGGLAQLTRLHPGLWRASQIGGAPRHTTASGFAALDAQLPGGGWPHGVLTELLLPQAGVGELRLLAPALAALAADSPAGAPAPRGAGGAGDHGRCVMLFDPPAALSAWGLLQCGLDPRHWLVVRARAGQGRAGQAQAGQGQAGQAGQALATAPPRHTPRSANGLSPLLASADLLWALAQSLKSGHVGAVLAWLPRHLQADTLRRLQIAAQAHDGPVFIFRDALARGQPSPAPLRLLLQPAGVDCLRVQVLKRRGPALDQPLRLALPSALTPHQQDQAQADALPGPAVQGAGLAAPPGFTAPALACGSAPHPPSPARGVGRLAPSPAQGAGPFAPSPARGAGPFAPSPARGRGWGVGG